MDMAHITFSQEIAMFSFLLLKVSQKKVKVHTAPRETSLALAHFLCNYIVQRHGYLGVVLTKNVPPYVGAIFQ